MKTNKNSSKWNFESGYKESSHIGNYPFRMISSGIGIGIELDLRAFEGDFENQCNGLNQGFKIRLTIPGENIKMSKNSIKLPLEKDFQIAIKPKWIIT